jgi:hypothetical protein
MYFLPYFVPILTLVIFTVATPIAAPCQQNKELNNFLTDLGVKPVDFYDAVSSLNEDELSRVLDEMNSFSSHFESRHQQASDFLTTLNEKLVGFTKQLPGHRHLGKRQASGGLTLVTNLLTEILGLVASLLGVNLGDIVPTGVVPSGVVPSGVVPSGVVSGVIPAVPLTPSVPVQARQASGLLTPVTNLVTELLEIVAGILGVNVSSILSNLPVGASATSAGALRRQASDPVAIVTGLLASLISLIAALFGITLPSLLPSGGLPSITLPPVSLPTSLSVNPGGPIQSVTGLVPTITAP